jgi:hypothetical protein
MNKALSPSELYNLTTTADVPVMTRREKLLRFARIVRQTQTQFIIFSNLEYMNPAQLSQCDHPHSPFAAAAADSTLRNTGLTGQTAADAMRFFELSQDDLHAFSCDCGGAITNEDMARRIERIANRTA